MLHTHTLKRLTSVWLVKPCVYIDCQCWATAICVRALKMSVLTNPESRFRKRTTNFELRTSRVHLLIQDSSGLSIDISGILSRHRLNGYLASRVPSPPGKHTFQNCVLWICSKTAGKKKTGDPLGYGHFSHQDLTNQDPLSLNYENAALRNYMLHRCTKKNNPGRLRSSLTATRIQPDLGLKSGRQYPFGRCQLSRKTAVPIYNILYYTILYYNEI